MPARSWPERDRVVAGVEDEQRHGLGVRQARRRARRSWASVAATVSVPGGMRRTSSGAVQRVGRPGQAGDPLVRPAGHDRLAGRVRGRLSSRSPARGWSRRRTRPGRGIDGEHRWPVGRRSGDEQIRAARSSSIRPRASALYRLPWLRRNTGSRLSAGTEPTGPATHRAPRRRARTGRRPSRRRHPRSAVRKPTSAFDASGATREPSSPISPPPQGRSWHTV